MNLQWLAWHNLPWIKATGGEWRYALRNAIAMCLALTLAYALQLDQPYWAMTSAAVVSFPTVGGAISKSLGRIVGSLLGASAALLIAGHTLNEPWLFAFFMAGWLALCTWVASHFQNNVAYAFSLAGYTAAIIAFSSVNVSDVSQLWDITQARVCEVIVGILCAGLMMMILPSTSDGSALMLSLRQMHTRLLDHAVLLLQQSSTENVRTAHETVISQILTMNLLRIQAFWSHYRFRRQNNVLNYVLHQQLRLTSVLSSLRRMLLNWPDAPPALYSAMQQLLHELAQPQCDKYRLAQILRSITPDVHGDFRQRAFVQRLRYFCWVWLNVERWIRLIERADADTRFQPPYAPALARASDSAEAGWSALRTFSVIMLGCAFWIGTQWDAGAAALTLTAIACVLYSSSPSPGGSVSLLLKTLLWLSLFSFVLQFGLMVQISALWQFLLLLFPLLLTLQLFKLQQKQRAALWGQFIVFMGSFIAVSNPPDWDFQSFLNDNLAKVCGVLLAWLAFQVLQPGSDARRSRRHIRALRHAFLDQLRRQPRLSESRFESQIYHHISQLSHSRDEQARLWLLRWGVVLLNCSHIVWQLRAWQPRSPALAQLRDSSLQDLQRIMSLRGVRHDSLQTALDTLQQAIDQLQGQPESDANTLAGILWRLRCSLAQLRQAVPD
ncbi:MULTISPECIES: FUSC family protein [Pantoea]|uniref:FUSC family protein n=1 Tax=Pantoea TaxID=53335 RepID=UPI001BFFC30D|nr:MULTISPECIES: FUSC family protein [Pantoea]MBU6517221.1 FUSC family protein [Pantoea sp. B270]MDI6956920.1 FUSC family protein [Pantoea sp. Pa-EAmG]QZY88854.1 FUSC family protein [Pantoea dispersa]UYV55888.1 FUSC family protein [Pantoea dispersa]